MSEEFIDELVVRLSKFLSTNELKRAREQICLVVNDYDICHKVTDIVLYKEPIPKCFEYFIVSKGIEGKSSKTLTLYSNYIRHMLLAINKPLEKITPNDIRCYLYSTQLSRGISNRTLDSRRSVLSSFFSWISAEGYIDKNPMATIRPIKYDAKERTPLQSITMEAIRSSCITKREKAMIEFFYSTACRVSELQNVKINDVDFTRGEVSLLGKGNKYRKSYLSSRALLYLSEYLSQRNDDCNSLFISERKPYKGLSKGGIEKIVKIIGQRAGCENLFPHLLRHTSATDALKHGMDVTQLRVMLGHSSLDTTMIYAKVSNDSVKDSHSRVYD